MNEEKLKERVIEELKKIYDPEIPVNIYDLGLIYKMKFEKKEDKLILKIKMTLTSAFCPIGDSIVMMVKDIANKIEEIDEVEVELVFDPPWDRSKMSEEAKLQLGMV